MYEQRKCACTRRNGEVRNRTAGSERMRETNIW